MALVEPPRKPTPKPELCTVLKDAKTGDAHYMVEEEHLRNRAGVSPAGNLWWSHEPRKVIGGVTIRDEHLILRQENAASKVDVIILTHGQAYDLMDALSKVESR
jgi:hypothetical protein